MISKIKYTMFDENYSNYYFNFTSDEYNSMNLPYKNNKISSRGRKEFKTSLVKSQTVNLISKYKTA